MKKTRYLQLNNIMMLEYELLGEQTAPDNDYTDVETIYYTKLLDGHYCIYSPMSCEVSFDNDIPALKKQTNIITYNTLNHFAVPKDKKDSMWYTFIDNSYEYCEENEFESLKFKFSLCEIAYLILSLKKSLFITSSSSKDNILTIILELVFKKP